MVAAPIDLCCCFSKNIKLAPAAGYVTDRAANPRTAKVTILTEFRTAVSASQAEMSDTLAFFVAVGFMLCYFNDAVSDIKRRYHDDE
jgi:hypothetical protein